MRRLRERALTRRRYIATVLSVVVILTLWNGLPAQAQDPCKIIPVGQVNFGSEPIAYWGGTSARHAVAVPGSGALTGGCGASIWEGDISDFSLRYTTRKVGGLVKCSYSATFHPNSLGIHTAEFGFLPYGPGHGICHTVDALKLIGKGVPAALGINPTTVNFGPAVPKTDGVSKPMVLVNSTKVGIVLTGVSSNNADFIPAQNCTNGEIGPDSSCTVSITFRPSALGEDSGQISLAGDQQGSPQVVKVSGTGVSTLPKKKKPKPPPCSKGLCGKVESGNSNPVARASVTLFAVGTSYQSGATALASTTSDAKGNFALSSFTCPSAGSETYITAIGGDAGAGVNSAIGLAAALGPCGNISTSTRVIINELTTVATEWALSQFTDSSGQNIGAPPSNSTGLQIGFDSFANLADVQAGDDSIVGEASAFLTTAPCGASSGLTNAEPLERLNTLADILSTCVESNGPSSKVCAALFADTGTSSIQTSLAIVHAVASRPQNNAAEIFQLAHSSGEPFQPALKAAPDGWELELSFSPPLAELSHPGSLAVDADGNIWVASVKNLSKLPAGDYACGASTLTPTGVPTSGYDLAFDNDGDLWVASGGVYGITELPAGNMVVGGINFNADNTPGAELSMLDHLTLDATGDVWVTVNFDGVSELPVGNYGPGATNFNFGSRAFSLAFDPFGNLWVTTPQGLSQLPNGNYLQATNHPLKAPFYPFYGLNLGTDAAGDVWVLNSSGVSELPAGNYDDGQVSFAPGGFNCGGGVGSGYNCPVALAIDGAGNVWFTGDTLLTVAELPASNYNAGLIYPIRGSSVDSLTSLGIDAAGNVWMTNSMSFSVSELVGLAKPVMTPVQSCLAFETANPGHPCVP